MMLMTLSPPPCLGGTWPLRTLSYPALKSILHLSPQPEGPHSPLFRESGPGPVPAKEQDDSISILLAPLWRPASETISAKEVPGVTILSVLLLQAVHNLRWTQEVISGNQGVWASGLITLRNPRVHGFSLLSSGVSRSQ